MATTNVFFEFPCFIDRWLVNNNINSNDANAQYFVNKNDIIGHVRLDNHSITSFRAPVSGYLTILIRENIRVAKGLNVAAIHPTQTNPNHQITLIQNQMQMQQRPPFNARYQNVNQNQTQTINSSQTVPSPQNNMNHIIPQQIHPPHSNNHPFHTQIRHPPHQPQPVQHHMPMNPMPVHHHNAPHPPFIPPNHMQYHPFNPPPPPLPQQPPHNIINNTMYSNPQRPPNIPYHPQMAMQPQPQPQPPPHINSNNIPRYPPPPPVRPAPVPPPAVSTPPNSNISPNNTNSATSNVDSNTTTKSESNTASNTTPPVPKPKYPTDPRKTSIDTDKKPMERETTPPPQPVKAENISGTSTPNTMFTKHWNNKNAAENVENITKIKMNLHKNKKLLLVLDIDHTLVHATRDVRAKDTLNHDIIKEDVYEIEFIDPSCPTNQKQIYWVKLRPFLRKFLQVLKRFFCLAIYTMGIRPYADEILKIIDPDSTIFEHRMICRGDSGINQVNGMKDISHLPQCDPKMILIADDRDDVWTTPNNVVKVHKFRYWPNEQNLADIIPQNQEVKENQDNTNNLKKPKPVFPWIQKEESMNLYANITPETTQWNYDRLKMKANDNILYNTANILQAVHYVYYSNPNKNEDCREIYGDMKKLVFRGAKCAFTGVIPTNEDPRKHPLWRLIDAYGGEPVDCLSSDCTHLIAAKPGTFKVTKAGAMNIWVVHYNWVYQSVVEFAKSEETNFTNLREPAMISSFVPKYVHVKPQEFGNTVKEIRNGTKQMQKVITKHEHQRIQLAKQKEIEQNRVKQQQQQKQLEELQKQQVQQQKMQQQEEEIQKQKKLQQEKQKEAMPPLDKMNVDDKVSNVKQCKKEDSEEGEIKDEEPSAQKNINADNMNPQPPMIQKPVQQQNHLIKNSIHNVNHQVIHNHNNHMNMNHNQHNMNANNNKKEQPQQNVTLVINNNTQNDIVIQLPPPNAINTSSSKQNEPPVEKENEKKSTSELPEYIQLPTRKINKKAELIHQALPPHIALPEKNKDKILAQHQSTVSNVKLIAPPQPPKPQIIQLTAPKLNPLRYAVPAIPQHLKQPQPALPLNAIQTQNSYIPPSMTNMAPHILPPPPHVAIQQQQQQQMAQQLVQQQMAQHINMSFNNHVNGLNMNINTNKVEETDHRDRDYRTLKKKMKNKKHHRDNSSSRSSDDNRSRDRSRERDRNRDRDRDRTRDRDRDKDRYHRYRRSRSRSRSRSHKHSSHSSSVSSSLSCRDRDRDRHKSRDKEDSRRRRKDRHRRDRYSIISPRGHSSKYYDDPNGHYVGEGDGGGDKYDDLLKSYMSYDCGNKYSKYSRYSDEEQKIDYGMAHDEATNVRNKKSNDSVDYGAI